MSSFQHFKGGPGAGWTAGPEVIHISWLGSDDREHKETVTDGRIAHDLIEAVLRDDSLTLTGYEHKSERKIAEGPRRVRVEAHSCYGNFLYAEFLNQAGDGA